MVPFRFILHFSRFYNEDGEDVLANLKDFVSELVDLGVTVFLCPIIVSEILKFTWYETIHKREHIIRLDEDLVTKYFALLKEFNKLYWVISYSDGFNIEGITLKDFVSEPQYICISPSTVDYQLPYPIQVKK